MLPNDDTLDAALSDPSFCAALVDALKHAGIETPIADIPREDLRYYVGQAMAGIVAARGEGGEDPQADAVPDQILDEALADAETRAAIEAILKENGIVQPAVDVPRTLLKRLLFQMFQYAEATRNERSVD